MIKLNIPTLYSQNDSQWKNTLLGFNTIAPYTIGNYGCLLTTISMYVKALGKNETPLTLNTKLKQINGFENGGYYKWESLHSLFTDLNIKKQSARFEDEVPDSAITDMKNMLDQGYFLICEIDFNPNTDSEDMHFVGIYGYGDHGEWYTVDPWTGTRIDINVYGGIKRALYRYSCYDKPLGKEKVQITIDSDLYEKLVTNSTKYDDFSAGGYSTIKSVTDKITQLQDDLKTSQETLNSVNQLVNEKNNIIAESQSTISTQLIQLTNASTRIDSLTEQAKQLPSLIDERDKLLLEKKLWIVREAGLLKNVTILKKENDLFKNNWFKGFLKNIFKK